MRWCIGNGIFEMRNDGKMEISVMEGEENVVLGVEVRKRSRNGAGRIGNETVEIKKPSNFGVAGGGKYPRLRILGLGFI